MERSPNPEYMPTEPYLVTHTETHEVIDINQQSFETVSGEPRPGIYRHYKSTQENLLYYQVEKVVCNTVTDESLVIYRPLYETDEPKPYARPREVFLGTVPQGKGEIKRFHRIGNAY